MNSNLNALFLISDILEYHDCSFVIRNENILEFNINKAILFSCFEFGESSVCLAFGILVNLAGSGIYKSSCCDISPSNYKIRIGNLICDVYLFLVSEGVSTVI